MSNNSVEMLRILAEQKEFKTKNKLIVEKQMIFNRKIDDRLIEWKNNSSSRNVLEVRGARQVGKTFSILKFARENYLNVHYFNLIRKDILEKIENAIISAPIDEISIGEHITSNLIDSKETIIIIDKIQISAKVYNIIRQLNRDIHNLDTSNYVSKLSELDNILLHTTERAIVENMKYDLKFIDEGFFLETLERYKIGPFYSYELLYEVSNHFKVSIEILNYWLQECEGSVR